MLLKILQGPIQFWLNGKIFVMASQAQHDLANCYDPSSKHQFIIAFSLLYFLQNIGLLAILGHGKHTPSSGRLLQLNLLLEAIFFQIYNWLTALCSSNICLHIPFLKRLTLTNLLNALQSRNPQSPNSVLLYFTLAQYVLLCKI